MTFLVTVTTRTLSAFPDDHLPSVLVISAAKNYTFIRVSPPGWIRGGLPPVMPLPQCVKQSRRL